MNPSPRMALRLYPPLVLALLVICTLTVLSHGWISALLRQLGEVDLAGVAGVQGFAGTLVRLRWAVWTTGFTAVALSLWLGVWGGIRYGRKVDQLTSALAGIGSRLGRACGSLSDALRLGSGGTSRQTTAIQEAAGLMDEITTTIRRNADHADKTRALSSETRGATESCIHLMQEMAAAVGQVSEASAETQNIVKAINEIAFQTNLLSLNAAVEAARAGEAGAGFAVVAGEVRNLAARSARAADETSHLIGDIGTKINEASDMVLKAMDEFSRVVEDHEQVGALVDEIAATTEKQKSRIEQIQQAASELDRMVREIAVHIETSALASESIDALATEIRGLVPQNAEGIDASSTPPVRPRSGRSRQHRPHTPVDGRNGGPAVSTKQLIPLNEDEM